MRMFIPFRRKDHELIDYIYMVYYPERAKLTRMPAHATSPTILGKYEYKFQLNFISNSNYKSGKKYWLLAHGRSATDNNGSASPGIAGGLGTGGGLWFTNGTATTEGTGTYNYAGKFWFGESGWTNAPYAYGVGIYNTGQYVRQLAQKVSIVPTTPPEKRKGVIAFIEDNTNKPWAVATALTTQETNTSDVASCPAVDVTAYRNNDNCIVYPLAGSSVFHSTWFPSRLSDQSFVSYSSSPGNHWAAGQITDAFSSAKNDYSYWETGSNQYISNVVIAQDCDDTEVFECVYTVVYERYQQFQEQAHGVPCSHADGLSAAGGAHAAAINQHSGLGTGGYHSGTGVPLGIS